VTYREESRALDARILGAIERWHRTEEHLGDAAFEALALELFDYQIRYNDPYARYCASLGVSASSPPRSWHEIPPVPSAAFKDAALATFDSAVAALVFETSGTTSGRPGRHYFETRDLYVAALLAAFDRFMLPDGARLRYLNLVANPAERPQSSLGYMMGRVSEGRGDGRTGWYVRGDALALNEFFENLQSAVAENAPVCIVATAFALAHALDALEERSVAFELPAGSRIMETGGFKGRTRIVERSNLYGRACRAFGVPLDAIVAEYGMTELTSQYYDGVSAREEGAVADARKKYAPPWLRTRVVGPDGATLPEGTVGALVHVDLANRASCVAVATEDLGVRFGDALVLIGRESGAALRGCSLDAETLHPVA
jgi:hypothetical protein